MGASVNWMRTKILKVYPTWFSLYSMPDKRIKAIYYNMRDNGKFRGTKKKEDSYEQMTIFDFIK